MGVPLAILKRLHWGSRCTDCFDVVTKRVTKSKCNQCFSTGFTGGYHDPVRVSGRVSPRTVQTAIGPQGLNDTNTVQLIMLDYPSLEAEDVIVHVNTNQRYIVQAITRTELQTVPVHQEVVLSELARDNPVYRVLVNYDTAPVIY